MIKLNESRINQSDIYSKCVEGVNSQVDKNLLNTFTSDIQSKSDLYRHKALINQLHTLTRDHFINGINLKFFLNDLYTEQMSKETGSARKYYNYIKSQALLCANCFHQKPTTLDHYLPKAKYPFFSVSPVNLIPCCRDCNTSKGQYDSDLYEEQLINAYFDKDIFFNDIWLEAEIKIGDENVPFVVYKVTPPFSWHDNDKKRVLRHFERFKLNELYSAQANVELFSNKNVFNDYINSNDGLKSNLEKEAINLSSTIPNTWKAALYRALSKSFWFCNIGVNNIKIRNNNIDDRDIVFDN